MTVALTIETKGFSEAERALGRLLDRTDDLTPLMRNIGAYVVDETRHRFELGETPKGEKWKPSLRAMMTGGRTLLDRGLLRDSYVDKASRDQVEIGSADIRAGIHHAGGTIKPKHGLYLAFHLANGAFAKVRQVVMPARPALGVNEADSSEILAMAGEYLEGALA